MKTRGGHVYKISKVFSERFVKSAIPYMQRLLNKNKKRQLQMLKASSLSPTNFACFKDILLLLLLLLQYNVDGPGDKMLLRRHPGRHYHYIPRVTLWLSHHTSSAAAAIRSLPSPLSSWPCCHHITPRLTSDIRLAIILLPACNLSIEYSFLSLLWKDITFVHLITIW